MLGSISESSVDTREAADLATTKRRTIGAPPASERRPSLTAKPVSDRQVYRQERRRPFALSPQTWLWVVLCQRQLDDEPSRPLKYREIVPKVLSTNAHESFVGG